MFGNVRQAMSRVATALAFALVGVGCAGVLAVPAPALAATLSVDTPTVAAKKADAVRTKAQIDQLASDLATQTAQYAQLCAQLAETRKEISDNATQLAGIDVTLRAAQARFSDRAVIMYRNSDSNLFVTLLTSANAEEFLARAELIMRIADADSQAIDDVMQARAVSERMHAYLAQREQSLVEQQQQADTQRVAIQREMAANQAVLKSVTTQISLLVQLQQKQAASASYSASGSSPQGSWDPNAVISDANFQASTSMSAAQIQTFLDSQSGYLKAFRAKDHAGVNKSAAEMIADASAAFGVSPKVILVTLQKEQSLLTKSNPSQTALDWAMGCGKADSQTFYQYQGFGNQIWGGAGKLAEHRGPWHPGATQDIDGGVVHPSNASTYSLYMYTPHFQGTSSFWSLYWRYFGNPLA